MKLINSIEKLKNEAEYDDKKGMAEFYLLLNFGLRSSKRIVYFPDTDTFDIDNEINDSWQEDVPSSELGNETMSVEANEKKAFYKYEY